MGNNALLDGTFGYAPGKIILGGEHAVVYGYPAIAAAIDRGIRVGIRKRPLEESEKKTGPVLKSTGLGFVGEVRPDPAGEGPEVLRRAIQHLSHIFGDSVKNIEIWVDSSIPGGRGLGSSAALSVSVIRGVARFLGKALSKTEELELALELEQIFHGSPSGVDHTIVTQGGIIWYQREEGNQKIIRSLVAPLSLQFVIGITSPHGGTLQAVEAVKEKFTRHEKWYRTVLDGIGQVVQEMEKALVEGKLYRLGELMNLNQGYLNALGVSTPEIENLCGLARKKGALGAKLTGAGYGGAVIALCEGNAEEIADCFKKTGSVSFLVKI